MITVIKPGPLTTVQDLGRFGYQAWGMPVSGVVDFYAAKAANILVGNSPKAALLEMTGEGGSFHFGEEALVAVTGGEATVSVNGENHPVWSSFLVPAGGLLRLGKITQGYRLYLSCQGGLDVPVVMGSRSTYLPAQLGGLEGRILQAGDMLYRLPAASNKYVPKTVPAKWRLPIKENPWCLAVTYGCQEDWFSAKDKDMLWKSTYVIDSETSRMSYHLQGPLLPPPKKELISEPTGLGAVEVSADGSLLIVLPDHGTSRGFAKIAYVIHAHFYKLAQAAPGDKIIFKLIDVEKAADLYRQQELLLRSLEEAITTNTL